MTEVAAKSLETRFEEIEMTCPKCQANWQPAIARFVNVKTHPDARLGLLLDKMHHSLCPRCKAPRFIETSFEFYDPDRELIVQIRPEWEFKAGGGEDYYLKRFEDMVDKYAATDVRVDGVFGYKQMIERYLGGENAVAEARVEWERRVAEARARREEEHARRAQQRKQSETAEERGDEESKPATG
jgi:hypothetical protein